MPTKQQIVKTLNGLFKTNKSDAKKFWENIKSLPDNTALYSDGVPETRRYSYASPLSSSSQMTLGNKPMQQDDSQFFIAYKDWMPVTNIKKGEIQKCPMGSFVAYEAATEAPKIIFSTFGCVETLLKLDSNLSPTNEGFVATCSSKSMDVIPQSDDMYDNMVNNTNMWYNFNAGFAQPYINSKDALKKTTSMAFFVDQLTQRTKDENPVEENMESISKHLSNCMVDVSIWDSKGTIDTNYDEDNVKSIISARDKSAFKLLKEIHQRHIELAFDEGAFLSSDNGSVEGDVSPEVVIERFVANSVFPSILPKMNNVSCELDNGEQLTIENPVFVNRLSAFTGTHTQNHTYSKFDDTAPTNDALDIIKWVLENREESSRPTFACGGKRQSAVISFSDASSETFGFGLPCLTKVTVSNASTGKTFCEARFSQTSGGNIPKEMEEIPEYMLVSRNCYDVKYADEEEPTLHAPQNGYIAIQSVSDKKLRVKCVLFLGHPDSYIEIDGTVNRRLFVGEFLTIQVP